MMPGMVWSTTQGSRALGMFWSSSRLTLVETVCRFVSMTGVSWVTSTRSARPPTLNVTTRGTIEPALTGTFSFR